MSRVFDALYFSAANNYDCEETYRQRRDDEINAAWELHEAGEDLAKGIADNVPEFVWPAENQDFVWKEVEGFEGLYKVSTMGEVFSEKRQIILTPVIDRSGYAHVMLRKNGSQKTIRIHRLVAIAFLDNPEKKKMVNHKNGIKSDNRVENLEWVSPSENTSHAYKFGMLPKGSSNQLAVLNEDMVEAIKKKFQPRVYTAKMLANEFKVSYGCIRHILNGTSWR